MKQIVQKLSNFLIILCFSIIIISCATPTNTIYTKCKTPVVKKPVFDNVPKNNILEEAKRVSINCVLLEQYSKNLEAANKVCR